MWTALLSALLFLGSLTLPEGLSSSDKATLEHGVTFYGARAPERIALGSPFEVQLTFDLPAELPPQTWVFAHLETKTEGCRLVSDSPLPHHGAGLVSHTVTLTLPNTPACQKATLGELYTGLYRRDTQARYRTISPATLDSRLYTAHLELGTQPGPIRAFTPSDMASRATWSHINPWLRWLIPLAVVLGLTLYLLRRSHAGPHLAGPRPTGRRRLWMALALIPSTLFTFFVALDFIKDDAYISFRYAQNLLAGNGFVFNAGERVEGITNFLWTLLMVPFEALGWDLFQVSEVLGLILVGFILFASVRISGLWVHFEARASQTFALLWAGLWLSSSSNLGLWSQSGMEQALAAALPLLAAMILWDEERLTPKRALLSGVLMGLGCLTRPEIHFVGICLAAPLLFEAIRTRRLSRTTLAWGGGVLAVTAPVHLFRYLYYGGLFPNTFYVKTGDSSLVWLTGLEKLHEMFSFNAIGWLVLAAPLAFISRHHLKAKLVAAAIALGFMAFMAKVGVDEMHWHRLYLPALPFLVLLSAVGLIELCRLLSAHIRNPRWQLAPWWGAWALVAALVVSNLAFSYKSLAGFNGRGDLSGTYHPDIGKFITRHDRPGALAAFQDMGSTPYYAPDIAFLDFIGLVDHTVARARYTYGLHAFMQTESSYRQPEFNAEMREYFYRRSPEWAILTSYIPSNQIPQVREAFAANPSYEALGPAFRQNPYQFGIVNEEFHQRYTHIRTWPRSPGYYLSLFRRSDLYAQTPGEVVLDALPENVGGKQARFAGNLELLGSEVQATALEHQEAFLTTWWRVPGQMPDDTLFFFHAENAAGYRVPFDTIPGDFLYPASRWKPGQLLEHRVLFQLPYSMPPGEYRIFLGVYRRSTGERLPIETGPNDGQQRVELGTISVTPLWTPRDNLIRPTYIEEQRKYPERILDHGRKDHL